MGAALRRIRSAGERNMAFAGEQSRRGVQADPPCAGQIDFGPGVQIREIGGWVRRGLRAASRRP